VSIASTIPLRDTDQVGIAKHLRTSRGVAGRGHGEHHGDATMTGMAWRVSGVSVEGHAKPPSRPTYGDA
jgi:hypothetical protein